VVHIYIKVYEISSFDGYGDIVRYAQFSRADVDKAMPLSAVMYASLGNGQDEAEHKVCFF